MKRARDIRDQLERLLERVEIKVSTNFNNLDLVRKSIVAGEFVTILIQFCFILKQILFSNKLFLLLSGFFPHTAKLQKNGSYRTAKHPLTVHIYPSSGLSQVSPQNQLTIQGGLYY